MSTVLYINKLGDDSIAIIATVRRYFDLSFFEVSDLLEQSLPIELPPLDDTYVDAFTREMSEVQSEIGRTGTMSMDQVLDLVQETFRDSPFGQVPSDTPNPAAAPKPATTAAPKQQSAPSKDVAPKPVSTPAATASDSGTYNVRITNCGSQKLAVVKYVKELLNCGLAEAKDQVDNNLISLKGSSQQAAKVVNELREFGCLATVALAGEAPKPAKASTPTIGAAKSAAPKSASGNVQLVLESVRGTAFKILGIITKAYGLSYGDAGKFLRDGSKLPPLPAAEAAKVAEQLRALGCEVKG